MPYIKQEDRKLYDKEINQLVDKLVEVFATEPTKIRSNRAGHLNYIITVLIKRFYTKLDSKLGKLGLRYADYNEILGLLECAKLEFYRRQIAIYEDKKIKSEGDVD